MIEDERWQIGNWHLRELPARSADEAQPLDEDSDLEDWMRLEDALFGFQHRTSINDSLGAWDTVRAFVLCVDAGITPPPQLLSAVADGFRAYMYGVFETDETSLEEAFGLASEGRGRAPATRHVRRMAADQALIVATKRHLEANSGLSLMEAAIQVVEAARAEWRGRPGMLNQGEPPAPATLVQKYSRQRWPGRGPLTEPGKIPDGDAGWRAAIIRRVYSRLEELGSQSE